MRTPQQRAKLRDEAVALRLAGKSVREIKEAAQRFWLELTGAQPDQFRSPTLKRHNPKTHRTNVGESYRGCLRVDVRRSAALYRRIEGWARGIMSSSTLSTAQTQPVS